MSLSAKSFSLFKRDVFLFVTNLATSIVVARTLGPDVLGIWVVLQMVLGYAESFGRTKADIAAVYFLGKKAHPIGDVVFTLNGLAILTSAIIVAAVLWQFDWVYRTLFSNTKTDVRFFLYVILAQIPLQFLYMNYSYLYIFREDVATYNRMVMIKSLCASVVGIVLLVVFRLGLLAVVASTILSVLAGLVYGAARFGPTARRERVVNLPLVKDLLGYGFVLYVTGIIAQFNAYVARLMLVFYLPPAEVAFFAMAQNQGQLLNKVPDALNVMLYPRISKLKSREESARLAASAVRVVLIILSVAAGSLAFFLIQPLVSLLYGSAFLGMVRPFRIMLPGLVLMGSTTVIDQYFSGIGRADISAKIAIVPLAIQIGAGLVLIPRLGLAGAAVAFVATLVTIAVIQLAVFLHMSPCTLRGDVAIRREDFRIVARFVKRETLRMYAGLLSRPAGGNNRDASRTD